MTQKASDLHLLDTQLASWAPRLASEFGIDIASAATLGTAIARDVRALPQQVRLQLREASPIRLDDRLQELVAFQSFMDGVGPSPGPATTRAQVIVQNYVCFVYLGESCFRDLRRVLPGGPAKRCCAFLSDNPVRAFRNALAHANWRYISDFSGLEFWARKGASLDEPVVRWEASQSELNFWQALARCTAYAAYTSL
jgi:hypothetical protein